MTCEPLTVGPLTAEDDRFPPDTVPRGVRPAWRRSAAALWSDVSRVAIGLEPLTERCGEIAARTRHVAICLTPFTGYFSRTRIAELAAWSARAFPRAEFWVPDSTAALTLQAAGYSRTHADRRAGEETRRLRNQTVRFLEGHRADATSHVRTLSSLTERADYRRLHAEVTELYQNDVAFRASCRTASREIVHQQTGRGRLSDAAVEIATRFFLAELPLYSHGDQIFDVPYTLQVHPGTTVFFDALYARELAWRPSPNQGFAVMAATIG